jgi:glucose/arabinose dehydrogenase
VASVVPSGFQESVVFAGLTNPTVIRFAADGRVFVAEKSGLIKVFDSVLDSTPTIFADLQTNVHNFWDRGLLGMALDPNFPATPYVYVLYTYNHQLGSGSAPPRWPDSCPDPPGATSDGCVVSARLSRLQATGDVMTGQEQVLVEDWCQQYPSHSIGTVEFGPEGALYASGGDGASFNFVDYGQDGNPLNPCGDPPGGGGGVQTPPTAEGGALRSQDLRTSGDPVGLNGSIIRVDPSTGAGLPTNPMAGNPDANAKRMIAYGLRNPFRFTFRPGTSELWVGDVGWNDWEEIDRVLNPTDSTIENFGWPCYEGSSRQSGYDAADLSICENLYASPSADTKPFFAYHHSNKVVAGESCPPGSSSIAGLSFEFAPQITSFPQQYQGALFFADYSRDCIWAMRKNGNPIPSPGSIDTFVAGAANPVNVEFGPDGNLYYVDFDGGTIRRVSPTTPPPSGTSYLSDLAWTSMTNGWGPVEKDTSNGEASAGDGRTLTLNGATYAKGLGAHAASDVRYALGSTCTRFKAAVGLDDETGANGSVSFQVYAGTTQVYDSGRMTATTPTKTVDVSVAGASELRLVVTNGGDSVDYDHADWALARIECGTGSDTTPPTSTSRAPAPGATDVALDVSPTATFSEAMDPATLTPTTFTLVNQAQTPVVANVSYDSATRTAILDPSANLEASTTYTATVKGGSAGAKDVAGNALASDVSWSFTTAGGPNQPPVAAIDTPASPPPPWRVGDLITFSGHATDPEQGALPASALSWTLLIQHCPSNCHTHTVQSWPGTASGSFSAPDHEYPSYLELRLVATDASGVTGTTTLRLDPQTVALDFASLPRGLQLSVDGVSSTTPFTRTVIVGSNNSISATSPQSVSGTTYEFASWSDGGAQTHNVTAPPATATYTATYVVAPPRSTGNPDVSGQPKVGRTLAASTGNWSGSLPMTFAYEWLRCTSTSVASCVTIPGATASTYVVTADDRRLRLRARVTATNAGGTGSATSSPTAPAK